MLVVVNSYQNAGNIFGFRSRIQSLGDLVCWIMENPAGVWRTDKRIKLLRWQGCWWWILKETSGPYVHFEQFAWRIIWYPTFFLLYSMRFFFPLLLDTFRLYRLSHAADGRFQILSVSPHWIQALHLGFPICASGGAEFSRRSSCQGPSRDQPCFLVISGYTQGQGPPQPEASMISGRFHLDTFQVGILDQKRWGQHRRWTAWRPRFGAGGDEPDETFVSQGGPGCLEGWGMFLCSGSPFPTLFRMSAEAHR